MNNIKQEIRKEIIALKVRQWLKEWDKVSFRIDTYRTRPDPQFYLFTLSASELKALSGISRRTIEGGLPRALDIGIQRRHDEQRSEEIREFIHYGYPWSELSKPKRQSGKFNDLRNPGWLPTSVVVNILKPGEKRRKNNSVAEQDLIEVIDKDNFNASILLPPNFSKSDWKPSQLHPIEVIDGQHRLWAFEDHSVSNDFQLPVVAFHGLDISWQAYLFWTINIKPKRINASLAFDLYPLLRTEDWLQKFDDRIYRQTRAQELTEALWLHPESPWYQRINMLGEPGLNMVSQSAWINALIASYVKAWEGPGIKIGGLFGAPVGKDEKVLPWSRAEQAAFLIFVWNKLFNAIKECNYEWAESLRSKGTRSGKQDAAFSGEDSLLNTDQGIRGILHVTNDLFYLKADELNLDSWGLQENTGAADTEAVTRSLKSLYKEEKTVKFLSEIAKQLAKFDWRTSKAFGLSEEQRTMKLVFRGSGGYREMRRQLLKLLMSGSSEIATTAQHSYKILRFE